MEPALVQSLALAIGLGMLVGLERQWVREPVAGIRTFPLFVLLGVLAGHASHGSAPWTVAAGFLAVLGVLVIGNFAALRAEQPQPGITTEVAALVMYLVGAVLVAGETRFAIAVTGCVLVLLHSKDVLHRVAERIGEDEFRAITRLVLMGLVILPLLPDREMGPYGVLNPHAIWRMVVLIVGISMAAYLVQRLVGPRAGLLLSAVLGGLISSTAATIGYSRRTLAQPELAGAAALQIMIASTVVVVRVIAEVAIAAPRRLTVTVGPLVAMLLAMAVIAAASFWISRKRLAIPLEREPPSDLKGPLLFGALYALVLIGVAWAKDQWGSRGLYAVAAISGLTDVDAITLSTARLLQANQVDVSTGWRVILVGAMANLVFKGVVAGALGTKRLLARVAVLFGLSLLCGAALLAFWSWPTP